MIPHPQQDYLANSLAHRIIYETRRAQETAARLIWDNKPRDAAMVWEQWREDVTTACHEMNRAASDTIAKQHEMLMECYNRMPGPVFGGGQLGPSIYPPLGYTQPAPDPVPSVEELYRELKAEPLAQPFEIPADVPDPPAAVDNSVHPVNCHCLECDVPF